MANMKECDGELSLDCSHQSGLLPFPSPMLHFLRDYVQPEHSCFSQIFVSAQSASHMGLTRFMLLQVKGEGLRNFLVAGVAFLVLQLRSDALADYKALAGAALLCRRI